MISLRRGFLVAIMLSTGLTLSALTPSPASAKQIERACMASDRRAATQSTCRCIQRVADQILTRPDQRKAAKFFKDPDEAQKVRMSDANRDEKFWTRYKDFGNTAIAVCG